MFLAVANSPGVDLNTTLIVGGFGILAALITASSGVLIAILTSSASRAREATLQAAIQATEAARLLLESNKKVAAVVERVGDTHIQLKEIHALVNSNMTASMQGEFDARTNELAMMREVVRLNRIAGIEPSPEALAAIAATEIKVTELGVKLKDRLQAQAEQKRETQSSP